MPLPSLRLYRPVGAGELKLVVEAKRRAFPPRFDWQPIFYPVLSLAYAVQIARDWNARDPNSGHVGVVTAFDVDAAFAARYPVQVVGGTRHRELWVPSEELDEFNANVVGEIRFLAAFYGANWPGGAVAALDPPDARDLPA